jgi:hypothetical protein
MQNLINELERPRYDACNNLISPSNLNRRAASTIKQLVTINQTNALVIQTMQKDNDWLSKELNEIKNNTTKPDPSPYSADSGQLNLFE